MHCGLNDAFDDSFICDWINHIVIIIYLIIYLFSYVFINYPKTLNDKLLVVYKSHVKLWTDGFFKPASSVKHTQWISLTPLFSTSLEYSQLPDLKERGD